MRSGPAELLTHGLGDATRVGAGQLQGGVVGESIGKGGVQRLDIDRVFERPAGL